MLLTLSYISSCFKQNKWTGKSVGKVEEGGERMLILRKLHIYSSAEFLKMSISISELVMCPTPALKTGRVGDEAQIILAPLFSLPKL